MALRTRADYFDGPHTTINTEELARTSRMVARLTGYPVQYNKAIIGRNAFAHESGIHQHGVLNDRETYEIIDASIVGQEAAQIVLGKHSGRHAFADSLEKLGLHVQGDALNQAFTRFKELADRKVEITEADLEAIVAEEIGVGTVHRFTMVGLDLRGGTGATPSAHVVLADGDGKVEADGEGNGMIEAAFAAIASASGVEATVLDFKVSSVTKGGDALGDVVVQLEADGLKASGRGVATDVVEASARAYLAAVNKVVRMRERPDERAVTDVGP
jgi:2-isopropylmalate synthase